MDDEAQIRIFDLDDGEGFCIQEMNYNQEIVKEICIDRDDAIQMAVMILNLFVLED